MAECSRDHPDGGIRLSGARETFADQQAFALPVNGEHVVVDATDGRSGAAGTKTSTKAGQIREIGSIQLWRPVVVSGADQHQETGIRVGGGWIDYLAHLCDPSGSTG